MNARQTGRAVFASLALFALPLHCSHADDFDSWAVHDYATPSFRIKPGFHAVERLGFTIGGNAISKLTRSDGTIREISAGGLYQIGLGVLYQWDVIPFSAALTFNYHVDSDYSNNNTGSFRRNPLEGLVYFNGLGRFRVGGGMRYAYAARAESTINGVTERIRFTNTKGSIVEIGYQVRPYGWVNLRYVKEKYKVESYTTTGGTSPGLSGNAPYDGSHVGVFITYEY